MRVLYPDKFIAGEPLAVDILPEAAAVAASDKILDLVIRGYSHGQEEPNGPLIPGTFARTYDNPTARARLRDQRIPNVYNRGGRYLTITDPFDPSRLAAVLKTLPGGVVEERFADYPAGIAEIVVDPGWQGQRLGAAVLLTYLEQTGLPANAGLMSDVIDTAPTVRWFPRLGIKQERPSEPLELDGSSLPSHYFVSEEGVSAAGVAAAIKAKHPDLQGVISL